MADMPSKYKKNCLCVIPVSPIFVTNIREWD